MTDLKVVWKGSSFLQCKKNYQEILNLVVNNYQFAKLFADSVESTEIDSIATLLVKIFNSVNRTNDLIKYCIEAEFRNSSKNNKGAILRGNNIVSKLEGAYVKCIATDYLRLVLKQHLDEIISDRDLSFEVDPKKLSELRLNPIETQEALEKNRNLLHEHAEKVLNRILDDSVLERMPKAVRSIAGYTAQFAAIHAPESVFPLVGGFLMLRIFSPAIVAPEYWGIYSAEELISPNARRNLILLAKVLQAPNCAVYKLFIFPQNASNGVEFNQKEAYMTPLNSFIQKNKGKLEKYFEKAGSFDSSFTGKLSEKYELEEAIVNINSIDLQDIFELHRLLDHCMKKLLTALLQKKKQAMQQNNSESSQNNSEMTTQWVATPKNHNGPDYGDIDYIIRLLQQLGPSPSKTKHKRESRFDADMDGVSTSAVGDDIFTQLDKSKFLYQGLNNKDSHPVFYLIVNRVKLHFLYNMNEMIQYVFKMMDSVVNAGRYALVIDMSWARLTNEMKKIIYRQLTQAFERIFTRKYKKNISAIYIIHPNAFTKAFLYFIRGFTSRKLSRKIHEIYNWKQLAKFIAIENIQLPESSRDFITKCYTVTKVNSKGKKQERLIKYTLNSLLNIDPKTRKLQNEKFISEIEEISASMDSCEITMKFAPSELPSRVQKKNLIFSTCPEDLTFRRYVCKNSQDRDAIIQDIFTASFRADTITLPQEYRVIKVNKMGKSQERLFKLTCDSLLNMDNQKIKSEISFAGIEDVTMDAFDPNTIWLKFKMESGRRRIICRDFAKQLFSAIQDGISRYKCMNDSDESIEKIEADEQLSSLNLLKST